MAFALADPAHFWLTASGITLYFSALTVGGWFQGLALIQSEIPFMSIVRADGAISGDAHRGGNPNDDRASSICLFVCGKPDALGALRLGPAYFVQHPTAPGAERAVAVAS